MDEQLMMDPNIKTFMNTINDLKHIDENLITDDILPVILDNINNAFSKEEMNNAVNLIIQNLEMHSIPRA